MNRFAKIAIACLLGIMSSFLFVSYENNKRGNDKMVTIHHFDVEYVETGHNLTRNNLFNLQLGSSLNEVEEKIGKPNGWIGSGVLAPYYSIGEGEYAILRFKNPIRCEDLQIIEIVDDSKILEEIELYS